MTPDQFSTDGDNVPIEDLAKAGLAKPSLVRTAKVALAEVRRLVPIGVVDHPSCRIIREQVLAHLALDT